METLELRLKKNIKKRFRIIVKSCVALRCLSDCFVFIDKSIWFDLSKLKPEWDIERRPEIRGSMIKYFNTKSFTILTENREVITINKLSDKELSLINNFLEIMVPRPSSESVVITQV